MKTFIYTIVLLLVVSLAAQAQPQYSYNAANPSSNTIPFASSVNTRQWIYYPSDFPNMHPGLITKLYIKANAATSASFAWLTIKIGTTPLTTFSAGPYVGGLTTVYDGAYSASTISGNWVVIHLQTPFYYDSVSNFVVQCSTLGTTSGFSVIQDSWMTGRSLIGYATSTSASVQNTLGEIGFEQQPSSVQTPLAVKLTNVNVKKENQFNTLSWSVAGEKDIASYQIERSLDAASFDYVGLISANNEEGKEMTYTYNDYDREAVEAGKLYYRLRIEETNGEFFYSPVVQLRSSEPKDPLSIVASPVPFNDKLNLAVSVNNPTTLSLTVSDAMGRVVLSRQEPLSPGSNTISFQNMQTLSAGMYFVRADIPDHQQTLRIIKN
jgi:hypothetical protein